MGTGFSIYNTDQSTVSTQDGDGAVFEIIMMDGAMSLMAGASIVIMIVNIFLWWSGVHASQGGETEGNILSSHMLIFFQISNLKAVGVLGFWGFGV